LILKVYLEYMIPVFMAGLGVIQAAAAHNSLKGMLFFRHKAITYLFSAIMLLPALYYLFTWNQRNVTGIIEGSQQAGFFFLAMLIALIVTLIVSSIINAGLGRPLKPLAGLDALRETTFFKTVQSWFSK
jgi:hypothetical protein